MGVVGVSLKLRNYQLELIDGVYESLNQKKKKIMVQSPAGSGKTVTMSEIARRATRRENRVLFVVHRLEIINQVRQTFIANDVDMVYCEIGMIQTITNKVKKDKVVEPTTILIDEAHHALSKSYTRILDAFPNAVVLGFTATPIRLSGKGFGDIFDDLILGKSVKWLIDNKRLAPYKYYSVNLVDEEKLKLTSTGDYSNQSIDNAMDNAIYGDVVESYKKFAAGKKAIAYTHNVAASKDLAQAFNNAGYSAMQVDGMTDKLTRHQAMEDFRSGKVQILVNAELYGEGVDVPDCQCVMLVRPTDSLTLYIQQSMRAMRYMPDKTAVIIDHVGNYTRHGLPDTDHDWQEYFNGLTKKKKSKKNDDLQIKDCPNCFGVIEGSPTHCTLCGYEFEVLQVKELEVVDTELTEITENLKTDYTMLKYKGKDISELKTLEDYYLFAIANGRKINWIKFAYEPLINASWPAFHSQLKPIKRKYNY